MSVIGLGIKKYNNSNNTDLNDGITSSTLNMTNTYQKKINNYDLWGNKSIWNNCYLNIGLYILARYDNFIIPFFSIKYPFTALLYQTNILFFIKPIKTWSFIFSKTFQILLCTRKDVLNNINDEIKLYWQNWYIHLNNIIQKLQMKWLIIKIISRKIIYISRIRYIIYFYRHIKFSYKWKIIMQYYFR